MHRYSPDVNNNNKKKTTSAVVPVVLPALNICFFCLFSPFLLPTSSVDQLVFSEGQLSITLSFDTYHSGLCTPAFTPNWCKQLAKISRRAAMTPLVEFNKCNVSAQSDQVS